nr:DUF4147 domain-containing protein [Kofleriaceae bacterium]
MVFDRSLCEAAFRDAVDACDPALEVALAIEQTPALRAPRTRYGLAIGKAALAMARGVGPVARGVAVTTADDGAPLPAGWSRTVAGHPEPDARSLAAGDEVIDLVAQATAADVIVACISGGASALVERPLSGVTLDALRAEVRGLAAAGAPIGELNRARVARSAIKGGKLARMSEAPVVTFAISDVPGDDLAVIGSGPTIAGRSGDVAVVVAKRVQFARAFAAALGGRGVAGLARLAHRAVDAAPMDGDVAAIAGELARPRDGVRVAWGEPTVRVPADHGDGGRAQQLALELARLLRGTARRAFVAGSDGQDGPAPRGRPAPAGAFVDGGTWDAIAAAGVDPARALARCDAGSALAAIGALAITGPTGVNHADVAVIT